MKQRSLKNLTLSPVELIARKRDGKALEPEEIQWLISRYVAADIPDYQISAFLMAVYLRGMEKREWIALTRAMIDSGETLDLTDIPGVKVDKHSTGGVGDKVSLILAPLVAAAGIAVPMMSGRGLGHSGGTLDKLESIPGLETRLSPARFNKQIREIGFAMMGQSNTLVPADRKLYALRDVTATISSLPLICSSIISKKKAEGADALVLDVKFGRGAFCSSLSQGIHLGRALVDLGNDFGLRTMALLTRMDEPLGRTVGNWLETREAIEALRGEGPGDLMAVVEMLGGIMMVLGRKSKNIDQGVEQIRRLLKEGTGFLKFKEMVKAQGGDISVVDEPDTFPSARFQMPVFSEADGYILSVDALETGLLAKDLGAGRNQLENPVDPGAGIVLEKKSGDRVRKGERLAVLMSNREIDMTEAARRLGSAIQFGRRKPAKRLLAVHLVDEKGEVRDPPWKEWI
jgi:pyrimidine-nucleoside phosphorylase